MRRRWPIRNATLATFLLRQSAPAAARFGVAVSSVVKWSQRYRMSGLVRPAKMGGYRKRILEPHCASITERLHRNPHLKLHGLKDELALQGIAVSHTTIWDFIRREGLSFKKTLFALEQARADVVCRRERWKAFQPHVDPERLVFIDETWIKTNMTPIRGTEGQASACICTAWPLAHADLSGSAAQ